MNCESCSNETRYVLRPASGFRVVADGTGPNIQGMRMIQLALHTTSSDVSNRSNTPPLVPGNDLAPGVNLVSINLQMNREPDEPMSVGAHTEISVSVGGKNVL